MKFPKKQYYNAQDFLWRYFGIVCFTLAKYCSKIGWLLWCLQCFALWTTLQQVYNNHALIWREIWKVSLLRIRLLKSFDTVDMLFWICLRKKYQSSANLFPGMTISPIHEPANYRQSFLSFLHLSLYYENAESKSYRHILKHR